MPLHVIKPNTYVPFLKYKNFAYIFSGLMIIISLISMLSGLNLGIDFAGGTELQVTFNKNVKISKLRKEIESLKLGDVSIQTVEMPKVNNSSEKNSKVSFLIRVEKSSDKMKGGVSDLIQKKLDESFGKGSYIVEREEVIGPKVGKELRNKGLYALLFALIGILIYVAIRFEMSFAVGSVGALIHDVIITAGTMNLLGREFNLTTIAALLTIVGYSLNDTIVVFDRIREDMRKEKSKKLEEIMNKSISDTLSRTLLTSFTTLLVVIFLLLFGGDIIRDFALALFIGIVIGTYSSIFVASPTVLIWEAFSKKKGSGNKKAVKA